jgi:vacuolar-type H+-ATPase subunit H
MTSGSTPGDTPPTTTGLGSTGSTGGTTGTTGTGSAGTASYAAAGTTSTGPTGTGTTTDTSSSTRDVAKDEARGVAQDAAQSGRQTAETAKEQAGQVAEEAVSQAKQLLDQTREQVVSTGSAQQEKAASSLRSLADELTGMVNGEGGQNGLAADLARQASEQIRTAAQFLENREPADLLQEVRRFARQRPGAFLLSAAAIGFLGGRLTRGLTADSGSSSSSSSTVKSLGRADDGAGRGQVRARRAGHVAHTV